MGKKKKKEVPVLAMALAGGISSSLTKTVTAPFGRIHILLQTQEANPRVASGEHTRYRGIWDCARRVLAEQGVRSFWRGNVARCAGYVPKFGFNMMLKDNIKAMGPPRSSHMSPMDVVANFAAGAGAGVASLPFTYPFEFCSTRLGADVGTEAVYKVSKSTRQAASSMDVLRRAGVRGMYSGMGMAAANNVAYYGARLGLYDTLKDGLGMALGQENERWLRKNHMFAFLVSKLVVAQCAIITCSAFGYPFQTVQRALIVQAGCPEVAALPAAMRYEGALDCARKLGASGGQRVFYRGFTAHVFACLSSSTLLVLYDEVIMMLDDA